MLWNTIKSWIIFNITCFNIKTSPMPRTSNDPVFQRSFNKWGTVMCAFMSNCRVLSFIFNKQCFEFSKFNFTHFSIFHIISITSKCFNSIASHLFFAATVSTSTSSSTVVTVTAAKMFGPTEMPHTYRRNKICNVQYMWYFFPQSITSKFCIGNAWPTENLHATALLLPIIFAINCTNKSSQFAFCKQITTQDVAI